jgi:hypothetical protein
MVSVSSRERGVRMGRRTGLNRVEEGDLLVLGAAASRADERLDLEVFDV